MYLIKQIFFLCVLSNVYLPCFFYERLYHKWPTVGISVLVRNKAHALPYFLSCLRRIDYPKDRMYIWIYSDYSWDKSDEILNDWAKNHSHDYAGVYLTTNSTNSGFEYPDEIGKMLWSKSHFEHVIELREEALYFGRKMWADYVFMLDADVYLTNTLVLKSLINKDVEVVAPMLISDGLYSNFWCGMTDLHYYKRTDEYEIILNKAKLGCFIVPMVHSAVLINLRYHSSDWLTYNPRKAKNYNGPIDDIITFAVNARKREVNLNICNEETYGFIQIPARNKNDLEDETMQLVNVKMEAISRTVPIPLDRNLEKYVQYPVPDKYTFDEIFMINLERRYQRRTLMELSFKELGMEYTLFKAIDSRELDEKILKVLNINFMPKYEDPYHKRPMKAGEIGCFLSHYYIWQEIAKNNYDRALVLEDDIRFVPYFKEKIYKVFRELKFVDWDLVYIGRKILEEMEESPATEHLVRPLYSYWTLGYMINSRGAQKLIDAKPLQNLLPVDEYIPIMFDEHPNETWKSYFPERNLAAYASTPRLVHPTHYTGEEGYISDTEESKILNDKLTPIFVGTFKGGYDDPLDVKNRFVRNNPTKKKRYASSDTSYKVEL